ncbi:hypothetical protein [Actinomycetospora chibensis]|uniref:Uncharacterized protein n=1 Tax=Actinomycetospora chibensis TaxID=663606 RepID=A0ABV9RH61_9PSEU|nr:hypothetical protein [Actinomycetospora chibensis]MDD7926810.1 hypothetical protein [Actinomycetospora chibensis]
MADGEHLVWHQDLICPGEWCRGRIRRFPPGFLVDDGRRERRRCPSCGTSVTAPAFYVSGSVRADVGWPSLAAPAEED